MVHLLPLLEFWITLGGKCPNKDPHFTGEIGVDHLTQVQSCLWLILINVM